MKKHVLLIAIIFGFLNISNANENNKTQITVSDETSRYGYMEPFQFIERGIEFYIFPNGEFDFNTHPQRRARRTHSSINISYGAPNHYNHYNGVSISHDHLGRVRRIGNVFVNYDTFGRIKRVGSVYMNYRHDLIKSIGGLHIFYNRHHRIIRTSGYIKHNLGCHFCGSHNCHINHYSDTGHGHHNGHGQGHNWHNDNMYYRNKNSKKNKNKR
jgi:hypothetical protein